MPSAVYAIASHSTPTDLPEPDLGAVKSRQQATWASGDYAVIGTTLQIVGEHLCEGVDLRAGEQVLDVAAGNGNASLAAVRFDDGRIKLVPVGSVEGFERAEMLRSYLVGRVTAYADALAQTERLLDVLDNYEKSRSRLLRSLEPPRWGDAEVPDS